MKSLSFSQKLLIVFGGLLVITMTVYALVNDSRLRGHTERNLSALQSQVVNQSTASISQWLNTRLEVAEAFAQSAEGAADEFDLRNLARTAVEGVDLEHFYFGTQDGRMIMQSDEAEDSLPADFDPSGRPWFQEAQRGGSGFTEPYEDAAGSGLIITAMAPVESGRFEGVAGADLSMDALNELLESVTMAGTGYAMMVSGDGTILFHPERELIGSDISSFLGESARLDGEVSTLSIDGQRYRNSFHAIDEARGVDWYVGLMVDEGAALTPVTEGRWAALVTTVVGLAVVLGLMYILLNILLRPARRLLHAMNDIASGESDLTRRLEVESNDEFGQLASGFNTFIANIQEVVRESQESAHELREHVESLRNASRSSRESVDSQQQEIEMVATAINEMSAAAGEVARNAQSTADSANSANTDCQESMHTVQGSNEAVERLGKEIGEAAEVIDRLGKDVTEITGVLEVIEGIAEQTNLLALNAAIEAARAGDAGRGFAVVADEVRALAKRTQDSTEQVNEMIGRLQKGAESAVSVMQESRAVSNMSMEKAQDAMEALKRITDAIAQISDMTNQIATASEEQTSAVEELNSSITRIADQGQETASSASENDRLSNEISEVGTTLHDKVARFKV